MVKWIPLSLLMFFFFGCSGFRIQEKVNNEPSKGIYGIPFYSKKPVLIKSTVYCTPIYDVTLTLNKEKIKKNISKQRTPEIQKTIEKVHWMTFRLNETRIVEFIYQVSTNNQGLLDEKNFFLKLCSVLGLGDSNLNEAIRKLQEYSNFNEAGTPISGIIHHIEPVFHGYENRMVVDPERVFYLNHSTPIIGTSNLEAALSEDGTLTSVKSTYEDKLLSTVLTAVPTILPISDFLKSKWIKSNQEQVEAAVSKAIPQFFSNSQLSALRSTGSNAQLKTSLNKMLQDFLNQIRDILQTLVEPEEKLVLETNVIKKIAKYSFSRECKSQNEINGTLPCDFNQLENGTSCKVEIITETKDEVKPAANTGINFSGQIMIPEKLSQNEK